MDASGERMDERGWTRVDKRIGERRTKGRTRGWTRRRRRKRNVRLFEKRGRTRRREKEEKDEDDDEEETRTACRRTRNCNKVPCPKRQMSPVAMKQVRVTLAPDHLEYDFSTKTS